MISPIRRIGKELEQPSQREQEKDLNPFWVFEELEREQGRRAFCCSRPSINIWSRRWEPCASPSAPLPCG